MRKAFGLVLFSLILLVSLTTISLSKEKTKSDIFDLIKHAPLFGHAFNADEFTYMGICYPSFIYEEQINKLIVDFKKIDERTVSYRLELDCPPTLPLKRQTKGQLSTLIEKNTTAYISIQFILL